MNDTAELRTGDLISGSAPDLSVPDSASDLVGVTLNDTYVVERLLGEGGMGRVYLARHTRIEQKRVAVKVLHCEYAQDAEVQARFRREAEAAAAVSHPNVVAVLDIGTTPRGRPYLVCEYLEGIDLADLLRRVGRLDPSTALDITRQLCRGLGAAHQRGIVHRDLKPPNVFLVGDFSQGTPDRLHVKVLDFGLSRFEFGGSERDLTKTGLIMGTPSYMSPEQAQGKRVDERADIYGLGAILYKALTGKAPFNEGSARATILAVMNAEPPRPRALVASIPAHLELVIERAMAKDPKRRFADMAEFERALDALPTLVPTGRGRNDRQRTKIRRAPVDAAFGADVAYARPRLVLYALSALLLGVAGAATAIEGAELALGYELRRARFETLLLAISAGALAIAVPWFVSMRRKVWHNSSRVLARLAELRAAVGTAAATYGVLLLAFELIDGSLLRLLGKPDLRLVHAEWAGWNLILPAVALSNGLAMALRTRITSNAAQGWRRDLAVWALTLVTAAVAAAFLYAGWFWRSRSG